MLLQSMARKHVFPTGWLPELELASSISMSVSSLEASSQKVRKDMRACHALQLHKSCTGPVCTLCISPSKIAVSTATPCPSLPIPLYGLFRRQSGNAILSNGSNSIMACSTCLSNLRLQIGSLVAKAVSTRYLQPTAASQTHMHGSCCGGEALTWCQKP